MRCARFLLAAAGLLAAAVALAQVPRVPPATPPATPPPAEKKPTLPTVRLGAILPLSGAAAWFGKEMRQGMELAMGELNRPRWNDTRRLPFGVTSAFRTFASPALSGLSTRRIGAVAPLSFFVRMVDSAA